MPAVEIGRVCVKTTGRDAGKRCVVTKVVDKNNVMIKSAGRKKERKCSVRHIDPMPITVDANSASEIDAVLKA